MMKYLRIIAPLIILALCYVMFIPQMVYAKSSTALSSTYDPPDPFWEEYYLDHEVTRFITEYSTIAGMVSYDWYGSHTNSTNIYRAAGGVGESSSITYFLGHGAWENPPLNPIEHHYKLAVSDGTVIMDDWIYPYSEDQSVEFVLMWSCELGNEIGGWHLFSGAYGMPHCWLHTTDLSEDGYDNPDNKCKAFIGFEESAPWLHFDYFSEDETFVANASFHFLRWFYYFSLNFGAYYSINEALDVAVRRVWGHSSFGESFLYYGYYLDEIRDPPLEGRMVVYGDGNMHLSGMRVGMKTKTDGYFYIPCRSANPSWLDIPLLFNDPDIIGDQHGTEVDGYPFEFPDGEVDMRDVGFVSRKYGLQEQQIGWDYMADVDLYGGSKGKIDMRDVGVVSQNYGKSGSYIYDLTGVTVTFDTGDVVPIEYIPELGMYTGVPIPEGAETFIVKKDAVPIGAMIIPHD